MNVLMSWLIQSKPDCPADILCAAWDSARHAGDVEAMADVAAHRNVPERLDALISASPHPVVRAAHLTREGLPAERAAELLVGERRLAVLVQLTGPDVPRWIVDRVIEALFEDPSVELATALLHVTPLGNDDLDQIYRTLLPLLGTPHSPPSAELFHRVSQIADLTLRDQYVIALLPLIFRDRAAAAAFEALLGGPLSADVLQTSGKLLLKFAVRAMAAEPDDTPRYADRISATLLRALLRALLGRQDLPPALLPLIKRVAAHSRAHASGLGFMETFVRNEVAVDLRTSCDLQALGQAVGYVTHTSEVLDLLNNPHLTAEQQVNLLGRVTVSSASLAGLRDVPDAVKLMLLVKAPVVTALENGWRWFPDPLAAQRAFLHAHTAQVRGDVKDMSLSDSRSLGEVLKVHYTHPLDEQSWAQLPTSTLLLAAGQDQFVIPLIDAVSSLLQASLGSDEMAWQAFAALLESFDGTVAELLEVSALMIAPEV